MLLLKFGYLKAASCDKSVITNCIHKTEIVVAINIRRIWLICTMLRILKVSRTKPILILPTKINNIHNIHWSLHYLLCLNPHNEFIYINIHKLFQTRNSLCVQSLLISFESDVVIVNPIQLHNIPFKIYYVHSFSLIYPTG